MKPARSLLVASAALAVALTGCYTTHIGLTNPQAAGARSPAVDGAMHWSVLGFIEASSPVNLAAACAGSTPASIDEDVGVLGGIVNAVLGTYVPVLSVHNASVNCAVPPH